MFCFHVSSAICRKYDEKRKKLRLQESRGVNQIDIDFTCSADKDLYSQSSNGCSEKKKQDFISKNIEDLRDEDLQPQLDRMFIYIRVYQSM